MGGGHYKTRGTTDTTMAAKEVGCESIPKPPYPGRGRLSDRGVAARREWSRRLAHWRELMAYHRRCTWNGAMIQGAKGGVKTEFMKWLESLQEPGTCWITKRITRTEVWDSAYRCQEGVAQERDKTMPIPQYTGSRRVDDSLRRIYPHFVRSSKKR
eukprot:gene19978-biopygen1004